MKSDTRKPFLQRDFVRIPVVCETVCNDALKRFRELGQTTTTCQKDSAFSVSFASCDDCIVLASGGAILATPDMDEFHSILNYCASINSPISTDATKTLQASPQPSNSSPPMRQRQIERTLNSSSVVTSTETTRTQTPTSALSTTGLKDLEATSSPSGRPDSRQPGTSHVKVVLIACVIIVPMLLIIVAIAIFLSMKTRQGKRPHRKKHQDTKKNNHEDKPQLHSESVHRFELPLTLTRRPELMNWWNELFELRTRERIHELSVENVVSELPAVEPVGSELPTISTQKC